MSRQSKTVLVPGGQGWVGQRFVRHLEERGMNPLPLSRREVDYTQSKLLKEVIKDTGASFLINCAGYTGKPNVDACELHKAECLEGNAVLPGVIREVCEDLGLPWGHVSSGCIYSGNGPDGLGFRESDLPNFSFRQGPCSFYSGTKALGEEILEGADRCFIWRLRIPFDNLDFPRNYLSKVLTYHRLLEARNSLSHLDEFVKAACDGWVNEVEFGVYNLTNPGSITTSRVVELARKHLPTDKEFSFFDSEEQFLKEAAKTPRSNCVLNTDKAREAGLVMRPVEEAVIDSFKNWRSAG